MIPLADDNPTRTTPYVVYALIILNVLAYAYDMLGPHGPIGGALWNYSMVPKSVVTGEPTEWIQRVRVLLPNGLVAVKNYAIVHRGLNPQWLTIFTSMFMHGGLLHIGGNMLYLWIFGNNIEDTLGHAKFLFFYLLCGVLAAFAHIAVNPASTVPTVGASGAIAGVLGAYILLFPHARIRTLIFIFYFIDYVAIPASIVLGVWFLMQLVGLGGSGGQIGGGVAYGAHVGGFVAGLVIVWLLGGKKLIRRRYIPPSDQRPYPFRPWK